MLGAQRDVVLFAVSSVGARHAVPEHANSNITPHGNINPTHSFASTHRARTHVVTCVTGVISRGTFRRTSTTQYGASGSNARRIARHSSRIRLSDNL
jgi:hypothetical protein